MFTNRIVQLNITDILIDRPNRQRTELTTESVLDLAYSIAKSQWISPILVDKDTNHIIAGERRLTAVKTLHAVVNGDYSSFTDPDQVRDKLARFSTCQVDSWDNWSKIPAQLGTNLTEQDIVMYEFIENVQRKDLNWLDRAKAIYTIHSHGLATEKDWNNFKTGSIVGLESSVVARNLKLWRYMADELMDEKVRGLITESKTLMSAIQAVERFTSRRSDNIVDLSGKTIPPKPANDTDLVKKPGPKTLDPSKVLTEDSDLSDWMEDPVYDKEPEPDILNQPLLNEDFHLWAEEYAGQPFNFIHCDFPYGINFNKSAQAGRAMAKLTDYDDSEEVYWELLNSLATHQDKLIASSAHIMFWFSLNMYDQTRDAIKKLFPTATIQSHPMIWHCSDNVGILPDSQRYGRRTYETALLLTFGDRLVTSAKALSFASPREQSTRVHRSQKPLPVLEHFFSMFVDDASRVLDPTAGSGTSLIAATQLGAKQVIGLESNKETFDQAITHIDHELNKLQVSL